MARAARRTCVKGDLDRVLGNQLPQPQPTDYVFPFERYGAAGDDFKPFSHQTAPAKPIVRWKEAWEVERKRAGVPFLSAVKQTEKIATKEKFCVAQVNLAIWCPTPRTIPASRRLVRVLRFLVELRLADFGRAFPTGHPMFCISGIVRNVARLLWSTCHLRTSQAHKSAFRPDWFWYQLRARSC
jgi:hypothetical protein